MRGSEGTVRGIERKEGSTGDGAGGVLKGCEGTVREIELNAEKEPYRKQSGRSFEGQ